MRPVLGGLLEDALRRSRARRERRGFTLIELLVTVSIIAILGSIALPKFADLIQKSQEGATKGSLGSLRWALSIYYSDNGGAYPNCLITPASPIFTSYLAPNYIPNVDLVKDEVHPPTNNVYCDSAITAGNVHDGQGWYYNGDVNDPAIGNLYVACDHTDSKGSYWSNY
jgi:prepilin-type N-terminal cleavage/methylation domain-containing protein